MIRINTWPPGFMNTLALLKILRFAEWILVVCLWKPCVGFRRISSENQKKRRKTQKKRRISSDCFFGGFGPDFNIFVFLSQILEIECQIFVENLVFFTKPICEMLVFRKYFQICEMLVFFWQRSFYQICEMLVFRKESQISQICVYYRNLRNLRYNTKSAWEMWKFQVKNLRYFRFLPIFANHQSKACQKFKNFKNLLSHKLARGLAFYKASAFYDASFVNRKTNETMSFCSRKIHSDVFFGFPMFCSVSRWNPLAFFGFPMKSDFWF